MISIHAPREGCDWSWPTSSLTPLNFNPRTPRGVRQRHPLHSSYDRQFQSTHPARGATTSGGRRYTSALNFNPRTPRGVRRCIDRLSPWHRNNFNPRTPRGVRPSSCIGYTPNAINFNPRTPRGVRLNPARLAGSVGKFQSTHPARGATANFTKEQRVCLAQFAYLHKGKKAEHTKTNAPMLH